ncbi:MAG: NADH-quinone oxidoreductase subunit A [Candidatus Diapherotrites archaeon]|nr:NADH-quinone oxidoreductase subunit A [Candidatus Diapherotrites archaeon]
MDLGIEALVFSPLTMFLLSLALAFLVYAIGARIAPKLKDEGDKLKSYACGEELPETNPRPSYNFFHLAVLFTIFHVSAIVITAESAGIAGGLALVYAFFMLVSIVVLMGR